MANQTGKRMVCSSCGSEMLITRGGNGELQCCGQPMTLRVAPPSATQAPQEQPRG